MSNVVTNNYTKNNPQSLQFAPKDKEEIAFMMKKAVKKSGLTLAEISDQLEKHYGENLSISGRGYDLGDRD